MKRVQIITFCCVNRKADCGQIEEFLCKNGYEVSITDGTQGINVDKSADIILIITCGTTKGDEDRSFDAYYQIQAEKKLHAKVIFGGCVPKINPERVAEEVKVETLDPGSYTKLNHLFEITHEFEEFRQPNVFNKPLFSRQKSTAAKYIKHTIIHYTIGVLKECEFTPSGILNTFKILRTGIIFTRNTHQKTFYIQIQAGCSGSCSYCAVRKAIGPVRSKSMERVLDEFRLGLNDGYKHFHLYGDDSGNYGIDIGTNLGILLKNISLIEGDFDIALHNINPASIPNIINPLRMLCGAGKLYGLYIPIQSANRRILRLMNRDCNWIEIVKQDLIDLKKIAPLKFMLGTTILIGFPSEKMCELDETIRYCREIGFDYIVCYLYSARPNTPAATMIEQISPDEGVNRVRLAKSKLSKTSLVSIPEG